MSDTTTVTIATEATTVRVDNPITVVREVVATTVVGSGSVGPQGQQGDPGNDGAAGTAGADGATWRTGAGAPSNGLGANGDLYLDTDTSDVYQRTTGTYAVIANIKGDTGAAGTNGTNGNDGAAGVDGSTVLNGSGAPSSGLGANGDFYIDTTAHAIYGPKTAGAWGSATSLVGPQGDPGNDGAPGSPGAAGQGVPAGGSTGQVLAKNSATDYDTEWVAQSGGSGGPLAIGATQTVSFTPVLADAESLIPVDNSGAGVVVTLPATASVAFPVGTRLAFVALSTTGMDIVSDGTSVVQALGGVASLVSLPAWTYVEALLVATDTWYVSINNEPTITSLGIGFAVNPTVTEVDFGTTPVTSASFTVGDANVTAAKVVKVWQHASTATGRVGSDEEWDALTCTARPSDGSFILTAHCLTGSIVGRRTFAYTIHAVND